MVVQTAGFSAPRQYAPPVFYHHRIDPARITSLHRRLVSVRYRCFGRAVGRAQKIVGEAVITRRAAGRNASSCRTVFTPAYGRSPALTLHRCLYVGRSLHLIAKKSTLSVASDRADQAFTALSQRRKIVEPLFIRGVRAISEYSAVRAPGTTASYVPGHHRPVCCGKASLPPTT